MPSERLSLYFQSLFDRWPDLAFNIRSKEDIYILSETHCLLSSDAQFITSIIKEINLPDLSTLPNFGNWYLRAEWGSTQDESCIKIYNPYLGLEIMLPYARGVSAKAYNFNQNGVNRDFEYERMLLLLKI